MLSMLISQPAGVQWLVFFLIIVAVLVLSVPVNWVGDMIKQKIMH